MRSPYRQILWGVSGILLSSMPMYVSAEDEEIDAEVETETTNFEEMEIIGIGPIQGTGVPKNMVPANVQTISSDEIQRYQSLTLGEQMNRQLGSVNINQAQNNPFQPDVQYRGYTASPLLGLPQGLSVYVDGVRFNEPFGDTVNWDLIPDNAIEEMVLHPGSDPVYGLNALGGAISIQTKTGFTSPGHHLEVEGGSWGRHTEELTSGWNNGTVAYFFDIKNFEENGWRDKSPTDVRQGLLNLAYEGDKGGMDLTLAMNDNDMVGNGSLPIQLQKQDDRAIFTYPDETRTRLFLATLNTDYWFTDDFMVTTNSYFRQNKVKSFNGDDSDYEECEDSSNSGYLCSGDDDDDEEVVIDTNGNKVVADDDVEGGTNNFSQTNQRSYGGTIQTTYLGDIFGFKNHFVLGSSYDYAQIHFESDTELGSLTESRGTTRSGILVDDARVRLIARTKHFGLFFSDTFSLTNELAVTVSGRYNRSQMEMHDQYGDDLNGNHTYDRFNPSAGLTYNFSPELNAYLRYGESNRAPTAMELSCANPDAPCKLPNAFVSDPPLKQVISQTWEAGFRGRFSNLWHDGYVDWHAGVFHAINRRDIIFMSTSGLTNEGYFSNVGKTRRRGVELSLNSQFENVFSDIDDWFISANYSYVNAEFLDDFLASSPNNPYANADGQVQVKDGDRIPGIPEHIFKFTAGVDLWNRWTLEIDGIFNGNQVYRGDEGNDLSKLGGYWVFHARSEFMVNKYLSFYGKVNNLLDREYKTFGVLGEADEVLGDNYDDPRFVGQGEPISAWIGMRLSL